MIAKESVIEGKESMHFVLVEGFTQTAFPGGSLVPTVQLVDSNAAARLIVTLQEFSQRFTQGAGRGVVIPIRR
jgi:hypothetical protein